MTYDPCLAMQSPFNWTNSLDGDEAGPMGDASLNVEAPSSSVKRKKRKKSAPDSDDKEEEDGGGDTSVPPAAAGALDVGSALRHCWPRVELCQENQFRLMSPSGRPIKSMRRRPLIGARVTFFYISSP